MFTAAGKSWRNFHKLHPLRGINCTMEHFERTPPKSTDRLQAGLQALRRGETPEAGPGLQAGDEIPVAAFHQPRGAQLYQELLLSQGVFSSAQQVRGQTQVLVDARDRARAAELLELHLRQHPDTLPRGHRRQFDFAIFGTLIAGAIGFAVTVGQLQHWRSVAVCGFFCLIGFLSGYFLDRSRYKRRRLGRWQFGIGDLLALMGAFSLAWLAWQILAGK